MHIYSNFNQYLIMFLRFPYTNIDNFHLEYIHIRTYYSHFYVSGAPDDRSSAPHGLLSVSIRLSREKDVKNQKEIFILNNKHQHNKTDQRIIHQFLHKLTNALLFQLFRGSIRLCSVYAQSVCLCMEMPCGVQIDRWLSCRFPFFTRK